MVDSDETSTHKTDALHRQGKPREYRTAQHYIRTWYVRTFIPFITRHARSCCVEKTQEQNECTAHTSMILLLLYPDYTAESTGFTQGSAQPRLVLSMARQPRLVLCSDAAVIFTVNPNYSCTLTR